MMSVRTGCTRLPGEDSMKVVLLRGINTTSLTEDSPPPLNGYTGGPKPEKIGKYLITGTYSYKSTNGARRTVFVSNVEKAKALQTAEEKRLAEADPEHQLQERMQHPKIAKFNSVHEILEKLPQKPSRDHPDEDSPSRKHPTRKRPASSAAKNGYEDSRLPAAPLWACKKITW